MKGKNILSVLMSFSVKKTRSSSTADASEAMATGNPSISRKRAYKCIEVNRSLDIAGAQKLRMLFLSVRNQQNKKDQYCLL